MLSKMMSNDDVYNPVVLKGIYVKKEVLEIFKHRGVCYTLAN